MSKLLHSWLTFMFLIFLPMGRLEQILNLTLLKILCSVPCMYAIIRQLFRFQADSGGQLIEERHKMRSLRFLNDKRVINVLTC